MLWLTKSDRAALARDVAHLAEALLLERRVADRQHLVDEQDLGLEVRRHREGEPHVHAARVALHRRVEEPLDLGERDDLVELARRSPRCRMPRIAPFRKMFSRPVSSGMEAGADLQQRPDAAVDLGAARRSGSVIARQDLEQRALARAVAPMMPTTSPCAISNDDVAQRPELRVRRASAAAATGSAVSGAPRHPTGDSRSVPA